MLTGRALFAILLGVVSATLNIGNDPRAVTPLRDWLLRNVTTNSDTFRALATANRGWRKEWHEALRGQEAMSGLDICPKSSKQYLQPLEGRIKPSTLHIDYHREPWSAQCLRIVADLWQYHFQHIDEIKIWVTPHVEEDRSTMRGLLQLIETSKVSRLSFKQNPVSWWAQEYDDSFVDFALENFYTLPHVKHLYLKLVPSLMTNTIKRLCRVLSQNKLESLTLRIQLDDRMDNSKCIAEGAFPSDQIHGVIKSNIRPTRLSKLIKMFASQDTIQRVNANIKEAAKYCAGVRLNWDFTEISKSIYRSTSLMFLDLTVYAYSDQERAPYNPAASIQVAHLLISAYKIPVVKLHVTSTQESLISLAEFHHLSHIELRSYRWDGEHLAKSLNERRKYGIPLIGLSWNPIFPEIRQAGSIKFIPSLSHLGLKNLQWRFTVNDDALEELGQELESMPALETLDLDLYLVTEAEFVRLLSRMRDLPSLRELSLQSIQPTVRTIRELKRFLARFNNIQRLSISFYPLHSSDFSSEYWTETLVLIANTPSLTDIPVLYTPQVSGASYVPELFALAMPLFNANLKSMNGFKMPMQPGDIGVNSFWAPRSTEAWRSN